MNVLLIEGRQVFEMEFLNMLIEEGDVYILFTTRLTETVHIPLLQVQKHLKSVKFNYPSRILDIIVPDYKERWCTEYEEVFDVEINLITISAENPLQIESDVDDLINKFEQGGE